MRKVYLLSTEHLEDGLWFRDEEDFKVAMNYVAIEAAQHPEVVVLAFILMSNHVHFVLKGTQEEVVEFINSFKRRYSMYMQRKYGVKEFLRGNGLDVKPIPYDDEAPERVIAYVQMNCVAANICSHPSQYQWGSGNAFFSQVSAHGRRVEEISVRARVRLLHSESADIPGQWIIGENGYLLPQNYLDIKAVEALYRSPKRLNYFLNSSSKAKKRIESNENLPAFKDQTILAAVPDLCRSLFQKDTLYLLSVDEQQELLKQIRYRFSADVAQIARVCGLCYADAAKLLD